MPPESCSSSFAVYPESPKTDSTLVNRILGRREAVVQDVPGVTRDRVSYDALWLGRRFVVQDTGGWEPDAKGLQQLVAEQASVAMRTADAIILVVDATVGATTADEASDEPDTRLAAIRTTLSRGV